MDRKKIPLYRAQVGAQDTTGIFAMSFVDYPANESHFVALKKQIKVNLNKSKQILTGVVLIPEQRIYRNDTKLGEYFMTFTAADIENIAQKMMKAGAAIKMTTHQHEAKLDGNYLVELWIVKDPKQDKAVALGLGELPAGTLMASYKIEDAKYWRDEVLTGNVKGFSLEGIFNFNSIKMSKTAKPAAQALGGKQNKVSTFLRSLAVMMEGDTAADAKDLADEAKKDEVDAGTPVIIFELADGGEVYVDAEGYATLNGEQMPTGEHALADGNFIVIDEDGNLVVTAEEAEAVEPEAAEAALAAAREKGKAFLAAQKKAKPNANAKKIAELEAELTKLKATSSVPKAKPSTEAIDPARMTHTQKLAAIVANRLAN